MARSADYDASRLNPTEDRDEDTARTFAKLGTSAGSGRIDPDDDLDSTLGLQVGDLASLFGENPEIPVVPLQVDEFTCSRCFLIFHHSLVASSRHGQPVCRDCT